MFRSWILNSVAALGLLLAPTAASAQSCRSLQAQLYDVAYSHGGLARDYPATHLAILACLIGNSNPNDREGCAALMVVLACTGLETYECEDLVSRWAIARISYYSITARMRAIGCPY